METKLTSALKLKFSPVVLTWSDEKPDDAIMFKPGRQACVMFLFSAAAKGKIGACDSETFGCPGGGTGLGFGNVYVNFPGGIGCFNNFLSTGNAGDPTGEGVAAAMKGKAPDHFVDDYLLGERYIKTPELVQKFVDWMPIVDPPAKFAVFMPLESPLLDEPAYSSHERVVTFTVDPDQLAALVVLCSYDRDPGDNVIIPFAAGCQSMGIFALKEASSPKPRAVVGMVDISARLNTKTSLGRGLFTISMPWKRFLELDANVDGSFLQRETWKQLMSGE